MNRGSRRRSWVGCIILLAAIADRAHAQANATRAEFLKLIDRPRVELAAQEHPPEPASAGLAQQRFSFASDAEQRVPGILLKPTDSTGRRPIVIVLHGTGGKKEGELPLMKDLAAKGLLAVAIDGRYHGERSKAGGAKDYTDAIARAFTDGKEHPFFYDTVWDVMRLIDYLQTRPDVDAQRIGLIGFSKGGIETYLATAADPRIAVAVPCIGVQSFHWALEHDAWQSRVGTIQAAVDAAAKQSGVAPIDAAFVRRFYDRVVPGIDGRFDGPAMLPLIAPRPLLVINGGADARTPVPGIEECVAAARLAYAAQHADDRFILRIQDKVGHAVTKESQALANEFLAKWLHAADR